MPFAVGGQRIGPRLEKRLQNRKHAFARRNHRDGRAFAVRMFEIGDARQQCRHHTQPSTFYRFEKCVFKHFPSPFDS